MALIRWNPTGDVWGEMRRVQGEMDRLFGGLLAGSDRARGVGGVFPSLNLYADDKKVTLRYEMPGVPLDKVDITITGDTLTVKGERDLGQSSKEMSFHRRERRGGYFNRTVTLPVEVDPEKAVAKYHNGVLEVVIDRAEKTKPRQIPIKAE